MKRVKGRRGFDDAGEMFERKNGVSHRWLIFLLREFDDGLDEIE